MELKVKVTKWSSGIPISLIRRRTADRIGVHSGDRIVIRTIEKHPKEFSTIVNTMESLVREDELAVSVEMKRRLGLKKGQKVQVNIAPTPDSLYYIKKKMKGEAWTELEINEIIKDVVTNHLSEAEIAFFVSNMYQKGMTFRETKFLVKAILNNGEVLSWNKKYVVDKHSIGGIAGNRTTPIVVAICAAAGLTMPKSSSRAITSAAGTADTIETIARVDFNTDELKKIISKTNACLIWGGALGMVPADSKIIRIEKKLKLDPEAQLLASIISKKLAAGSKYVLIDIPYGKNAKVSKRKGLDLKKKFEDLGRAFGLVIKVVLTRGDEPIGNGIGPALEVIDVINVLDTSQDGPKDLEDKSVYLAGEIFELTGKARRGTGGAMARKILESGKAFKKFEAIILAQGGSLICPIGGDYKVDVLASKSGKILEIDNKRINTLARNAGCPTDKFAGVYLYNHVGTKVKKGDKLFTIYAESISRLTEAVLFNKKTPSVKLG